ncbi:MAG: metal-dependent transcriptional regulator [Lachnospiraceae bacterium]|nr:metal-dependent transcriptional regulator [Lachnospiraceae bacterium]
MKPTESSENYLKTILILSRRLPVVRSVDIANEMGFKKSSVSIGMKNLRERELISVSDAGYISLTEEGRRIAETVYERNRFMSELLISWGIPEDIAETDACRIEHVISPETFEAFKKHFGG